MSDNHSTPTTPPAKPAKPCPDFPLHAHASGQWAAKIRGRRYYFGVWADPEAALKRYLEEKDALLAGRLPRPDRGAGATVKVAVNAFLNAKRALVESGELSPRTHREYKDACVLAASVFGKGRLLTDLRPEDFARLRNKMTKRWSAVRVGNQIQYVRTLFKFADEAGLIERPMRFGPGFKRPSKKTLRLERAKQGPKLFTADDVRRMIDAAGQPLKAMILLGMNCGFGNADCGRLPLAAVDLEAGWIDYPRPKTGMPRRCPLWPETAAALKDAKEKRRPQAIHPAHDELFFLTQRGGPWAVDRPGGPVSAETSKLLRRLGINGRKGLGFYTLRHTFRTVADGAKDQPAADYIMGHEVPHMSSVYRETIDDDRLRAVSGHVKDWLFADSAPA
jgi:integrase